MGKNARKPILTLDFDGVIHSYTSGWKGPRVIPDPPVSGALEFLVEAVRHFEVNIYSSRSRYFLGRHCMKKWLRKHLREKMLSLETCNTPNILFDWVTGTAFADPWEYEVDYAIRRLLRLIKFPTQKPPAHLQIDDRAITFTGIFPTVQELKDFQPWYRQKGA